ncbi:hypothetical protein A1O7_06893 [Cladophialophora yegresii CBS 114405]|uniref:Uncharacterized protein n=1 Tax=Cladophialophora yegresii CBS 114405 TaxID=1182544 RepID=W9WDE3_9EURO|nr:uncharacterized protein A1O7_06893 [Cladophialophora yegresii CBS 114405]EXJ56549.1 hypothetical protein A1O7_06893 [Cladophialophora yegresii CBS 114405]
MAANRGLRPEGLKIRGRAGLLSAGVPSSAQESDDTDEEGQFIKPAVKRPAVKILDVPIPPNFKLSEPKRPVQARTGAAFKPAEPQINVGNTPNRSILKEFIDELNSSRQKEGKGQVQLEYRENGPHIVDLARPARKSKPIGMDSEQKRVIWEWVKGGKKSGRTVASARSRPASRLGEAYLV